ncbi:MAG: DinB family protein [Candidatus Acidiferrum sp.]
MLPFECLPNRRNFLKAGIGIAAGLTALGVTPQPAAAQDDDSWTVGPRPGYSPEIGTLVSMLHFTRMQVEHNVKGMSQADLDFLLDAKANTIGAMLYHLAATDHYYGLNTFGGMKWDSWPDDEKKKWDIPMNLDEPARKAIKGNSLDYYLNILHEVREKNLAEFKKRDDKWLTIVDKEFGANNYGKWFHVAEHESNHDGQIKFLKSRLPGAKPTAE